MKLGRKTIRQETRQLYGYYKFLIKNHKRIVYHEICGTREKRFRMIREIERYQEYAEIDYQNGILNETEYKLEVQVLRVLKDTVLQLYREVAEE